MFYNHLENESLELPALKISDKDFSKEKKHKRNHFRKNAVSSKDRLKKVLLYIFIGFVGLLIVTQIIVFLVTFFIK